ncbi:hypothetical protein [Chryseobacterium sp.]|uniref:hypothetical protein n=1 Tax=Chryseobacterium sp. TaxID=1871047 RepID=UPI0024E1CD6E|nr:hypothetical protein [Chryseobacterium sp.]
MTSYKRLWDEIINDLDNDDIVLEIRILNTNIQDWKNLLKILHRNFANIIFQKNFNEIDRLNVDDFPQSDDDIMKCLSLNFTFFNLTLSLYVLEEIEFFSNSIITLEADKTEYLFVFCETISNYLSKDIYIFCEASNNYSLFFDSNSNVWN